VNTNHSSLMDFFSCFAGFLHIPVCKFLHFHSEKTLNEALISYQNEFFEEFATDLTFFRLLLTLGRFKEILGEFGRLRENSKIFHRLTSLILSLALTF